ncbi:MAG: hypothetical protein SFU56_16365 [Capsulimonadales bacterium]|nr:hypothetical protein [Capsulimonadales bacterium]
MRHRKMIHLTLPVSPMRPLIALCIPACVPGATAAQRPVPAPPVVTIRRIVPNTDSVKVAFAPVRGARDYRIFDLSRPEKVKYAGLIHRPDPKDPERFLTFPATEIEWNGIAPGTPVRLIVEAIDRVGPVPPANRSVDPVASRPVETLSLPATDPMICDETTALIGSNAGPTPDGRISINGQGDSGKSGRVLARSRPFTVRATGKPPIPSGRDAAQILFDTFASGDITASGSADAAKGTRVFRLRTPAADWDIRFQGSDLARSQPFVMDRHYMDLLFDGPMGREKHRGRSATALSPVRTADFSGGRILHLTMEIDAHLNGTRWVGFNLSPDDDPLTDLYWSKRDGAVNRTNRAFFVEIAETRALLGVIDDATRNDPLLAATGPIQVERDTRNAILAHRPSGNGHGLDNRSRFDLFVSRDRVALFEDGKRLCDEKIVPGLPFERAKVYFSHFLYHTALEKFVLPVHAPHERYWRDHFPYSDERHWDNLGFEVLPASVRWQTLGQRLKIGQ